MPASVNPAGPSPSVPSIRAWMPIRPIRVRSDRSVRARPMMIGKPVSG